MFFRSKMSVFHGIDILTLKSSSWLLVHRCCTIISGTAEGADKLGEKWAEVYGHECVRMPAKWDLHGKRAGFLRNQKMSKNSEAAAVFWDGKSRGTKSMIHISMQFCRPLWVWNQKIQRLWYYEGQGPSTDLTSHLNFDSIRI